MRINTESQNPIVIPAEPPKPRPSVVPYGGLGGLLFWVSVAVFLGVSTFHFYQRFTARDRDARALRGDSETLRSENQKLRSVVDQLQTELSQTGSLLRLQQDLLGQGAAAKGTGEFKPAARTPSASEAVELRTLQERLDKALAARIEGKEALILRREDGLVIALDDRIFFPGAGLKVGGPGQAILHEVAAGLQPLLGSAEVEVVAFADPTLQAPGAHKNPMTSWELSALRSAAVAKALIDGERLPPGQVVASCRGAERHGTEAESASSGLSAHRLEIGIFLTGNARKD